MYKRWNLRRVALWIFLLMQICLIVIYFKTQNDAGIDLQDANLRNPIKFIATKINGTKKHNYYTDRNKIVLRSVLVNDLYEDFNTSLCYKTGTDLQQMKRKKLVNWRCVCLEGWHGADCGQPEVIWRALLASRQPHVIQGRKVQRRLIYFTEIDLISAEFLEITLYELRDIADLFILYDYSRDLSVKDKLQSGFLKDLYSQIVYITGANHSVAWSNAKKLIRNLKQDDIFFINNPFEIPNGRVLQFLKLYDRWPEPLTFRLRWSVYGFFWKHPQKTTLSTGACTIEYLSQALDDNLPSVQSQFISNVKQQGIIVGDLNHFGGWFCEFCAEPTLIISALKLRLIRNREIFASLTERKIDVEFIEDLIENGLYLDSKTELERAHRSNEHYYAPNFVSNNSWKYDWLLTNLYSKLDYY